MNIRTAMANTTAARFTVLQGVIGCAGMRHPFTLFLAVVHDSGRQTRCILDQLFVILCTDAKD